MLMEIKYLGNMNKIVVIGDSHSTLYSDIKERNRGIWENPKLYNIFDIRWIGPVTFWRLCRDKNTFINLEKDVFHKNPNGDIITTKCIEKQNVLLVLGEIDVRCNILKFGYDNFKTTINKMINDIEEYIKSYDNKFNFHIQSIVPTIYKLNFGNKKPLFPFVGDDKERKEVTIYFNKKLKELSKKNNIGYFDIFQIYADNNNMMTLEKSDHIVHAMKNKELEIYIEKYFKL